LELINQSRAKLSALSVANDRMEYFRSLPYNDVGVIAGFPAGTIPQNSTLNLNGINFSERVLVEYVDDDADGSTGADTNGIILDYKQIKLEYEWFIYGATSSIQLVSNIVPRSIETTGGGGTVRINVLDADVSLFAGATVRLVGSSTTFPYDVTKLTDANGSALFNVPADSGYGVEVTANISGRAYSLDQTHEASVANPTPVVSPFAVLESDISTLTFQIGELSDLNISTYSAITDDLFREEFNDLTALSGYLGVTTSGGNLLLEDFFGPYEQFGQAYMGPITPSPLEAWHTMRIAVDLPVGTSHSIQFSSDASYTPIPDGDLPGNSSGFTSNIVDLSGLDTTTYQTIYVGLTLETTDNSVTPEVEEISVFYRQSESALPSVAFDMRGNKIIGTDISALPIYKYSNSLVTSAGGELTVSNLEFDNYTLSGFGGRDAASACPGHPIVHEAGVDSDVTLVLVADSTNTLRVSVVDTLGRILPGVSVNLTRSGYNETVFTDTCGQAFFTGGISAETDYIIDVSAAGYADQSITSFEIDNDTVTAVTMTE